MYQRDGWLKKINLNDNREMLSCKIASMQGQSEPAGTCEKRPKGSFSLSTPA